MKTKLLRKLRNRFYICGRNGKYQLFDGLYHSDNYGESCCSKWMSKEKVIKKRRKSILKAAQDYLEYKPIKK
jgi:hypothetical protein